MLDRRQKTLLLSIFVLIAANADAAVTAILHEGVTLFKAGKYQKNARLIDLAKADLSYATKTENIQGLLDLAAQENRIDAIQQIQLSRRYASVAQGDARLLTCLKLTKCDPEQLINNIDKSELHSEIALRQIGNSAPPVDHAVGDVTENVMTYYFTSSDWKQIQGQIGRQGIDGLYVKYADNGAIKDVLVVESKYKGSQLGQTKNGTQMSELWVRQNIQRLKAKFPENKDYPQIEKFIESGSYRALLWKMNVENNTLKIELNKIKSKGGEIITMTETDSDLSQPFNKAINVVNPKNKFEENLVNFYKKQLDFYGPKLSE